MKNNKIKCSHCKSKETVKRGSFETKTNGKQQRYYCKSCSKKFIERTPFYRMRNTSQKITLCLDLFFKGVSTRKIQEHLQAFYPHNSSNVTIYKWVIKYSNLMNNYTNSLKINCGNEIESDEIEFHRRKHPKKKQGVVKNWFVDVIDTKTRYMVSSNYVNHRSVDELKNVLKNAKNKTDEQIEIVTTDGLRAYPQVLRKSFGLHKRDGKSKITHKIRIADKDGFNYKIERLHNSVRQLTQNFRGFHGSVESARAIMNGYEVYYNFIRKHQGINKCPYELATNLKLKNPNRWLELIQLSSSYK